MSSEKTDCPLAGGYLTAIEVGIFPLRVAVINTDNTVETGIRRDQNKMKITNKLNVFVTTTYSASIG